MLVLAINLADCLLDKVIKSDLVLPAPVSEGITVVEGTRPGLSNGLSEVGLVLDCEIRDTPIRDLRGYQRLTFSQRQQAALGRS